MVTSVSDIITVPQSERDPAKIVFALRQIGERATLIPSVHMSSMGAVADGTTDDTPALNRAIARANSGGGNIRFIIPNGTMKIATAPTAITANNVFFSGENAPQNCILKFYNDAGLRWNVVDGGGAFNLGLDSDSTSTRIAINLQGSLRMRFDNIWAGTGIANLATLGNATGPVNTSEISFTRLRGVLPNVGVPLIVCKSGSGLFVDDYDVLVAVAAGAAVANRDFIRFESGTWDTAYISNGIAQRFQNPVELIASNGKSIQFIKVCDNFFDGNFNGVIIQAATGGTAAAIIVDGNQIGCQGGTAAGSGYGVLCTGAGNYFAIRVLNNLFYNCDATGVGLPSGSTLCIDSAIQNNRFTSMNFNGGASDAIVVPTACDRAAITDNMVVAYGGTGTARYGLNVGSVSNMLFENNILEGSTSGALTSTFVGCVIQGNLTLTSGVRDNTLADSIPGPTTILRETAIPTGGTAGSGYLFSSAANFGVYFGSAAPTASVAKGSIYLRSDGSNASNRAYINTGSTTWTALTTLA